MVGMTGGVAVDTDTVKFFDARDEHAIKLAVRAGLRVGVLSGRDDPANRRWAESVPLTFAYFGEKRKHQSQQQQQQQNSSSGDQQEEAQR